MTSYSGHDCAWSRTTYFLEERERAIVSGGGRECEGRRTTYFLEVEMERGGVRCVGPHECEDQPSECRDSRQNQRLDESVKAPWGLSS